MSKQLEAMRLLAEVDPDAASKVLREVRKTLLVPHAGGQIEVLNDPARFIAVRAGRRWGKTKIAARQTVKNAVTRPATVNWWIANRWRNTRRGYKNVLAQLPKQLLAKPAPAETANELNLHLINGSVIEFYSGESPDSLAGEGVHWVVMDEAALMRDHVWSQLVRPTLMDTGGHAMLISTPRGKNWFYDMCKRGLDPKYGDHSSYHFPQWANPYVPQAETDAAREELPDLIFRQEIGAEFVSNAASIFRLDREGSVREGTVDPAGLVVMGVDLAKKTDFTVLTASNAETREPCFHARFNELSWPVQRRELVEAYNYLMSVPEVDHVVVYMDATGGSVGDVVLDELEDTGIDVVGVQFTQPWKQQAVRLLAKDLERGAAHILEDQRGEFEAYEYEITAAGRYVFEAARGHDDEVSAKLLEHWGVAHEGPPDVHEVEVAVEEDGVVGEITPDEADDIMLREEVWR